MNDRYRDYLRRAAGYFAVVLVSGAYVATAFIRVGKTGKTPAEILSDGALALLLGLFINRVFDLQGMMLGERDERLCATLRLHGEIVSRLSPVLHLLPGWCAEKNRENLRECRRRILSRRGLRYEDYFEADGSRKRFALQKAPGTGCKKEEAPPEKGACGQGGNKPVPGALAFSARGRFARERREERAAQREARADKRCLRRALCLRPTPLAPGALTAEGGRAEDPYSFGRTKKSYETGCGLRDFFTKLFMALLFGYYGVELLENFSWGALIFKLFQVALFLLIGVTRMLRTYFFMTDEYRARIVKKIDLLQMFGASLAKAEKRE